MGVGGGDLGSGRILALGLGSLGGKFGAGKLITKFSGSGCELLGASVVGLRTPSLRDLG